MRKNRPHEVNFNVTYGGHQNYLKTHFTDILCVLGDLDIWFKIWFDLKVCASLCQILFFSKPQNYLAVFQIVTRNN